MLDQAPEISFVGVSKRYPGGHEALSAITFTVAAGSICALMGGSGSGKTTLVKLVNRMESADAGEVLLDGSSVSTFDPVRLRRGMGYVIQDGGLFPHWTAERNVALVPQLLGWHASLVDERISEAMEISRIPRDEFGPRYPSQLSGGQRQRVAIARAIAGRPRLLLLDEPFGALDPSARSELQEELRNIVGRLGMTVIMVTHDIAEAFAVADRIALIDHGRLLQFGTPAEIALAPSCTASAAFSARQALELRLRHLRLADVAAYLAVAEESNCVEVDGDRCIADALGSIAHSGSERFAVVSKGRRLGPFERRAVWDLLQRQIA